MIKGRVHSRESFGTVDGPGIRYVLFLQGCPMRCLYCHNPDTWSTVGGTEMTVSDVLSEYKRNRSFYKNGGITVTGGEPLMQAEFAHEVFSLCHENGINTCLDTSGVVLNDDVKALLCETDRVLLDIKYTTEQQYTENVGCSMQSALDFLSMIPPTCWTPFWRSIRGWMWFCSRSTIWTGKATPSSPGCVTRQQCATVKPCW